MRSHYSPNVKELNTDIKVAPIVQKHIRWFEIGQLNQIGLNWFLIDCSFAKKNLNLI